MRHFLRGIPFLFLVVFLSAACGQAPDTPPDRDPRVLADVNGELVTVTWFQQTYVDFLIRSGSNDTPANRMAHLDNLIDTILLAKEHDRQSLLDRDGFEQWKERVKKEELGSRYFETAFLDTLSAPTEEQIRETYRRYKSQAIVRHLFFRSPGEAEASWERLESGTSFLDEAQYVYGTVAYDSTAGYLGPVRYFGVDDAFAEAAWSLQAGTWSKPVRTRYGWHIVYLENMIREPLLTESEYMTRRGGMSSQYRLRRRRLEGDRFVREFMTARNVVVNEPAISALSDLLKSLDPSVNETEVVSGTDARLMASDLRPEIDESVVLATYEWEGEQQVFTAGDYAFWLDGLSFVEARDRTAASVGRALRNEVLARAGDEEDLRDAEWDMEVHRRVMMESARRLRQEFRTRVGVVDSALVQLAFERMGWQTRRRLIVSFDASVYGTHAEAEQARSGAVTWQMSFDNAPLDSLEAWNPYVATAPLDEPTVIGRRDDWAVVRLRERTQQPVTWKDNRAEIERAVAPFVREYRAVEDLRNTTPIRVDTVLFNQIADFN